MHIGREKKKEGIARLQRVTSKVDVAAGPKRFLSFSSYKQSKRYHPGVKSVFPAEKEREVLN